MVKTEMSLVSLVKNETEQEIKKSIQDALELIQYKFPKNIKHVVVKLNMCYYWDYTTGQTTHPKLVIALIELIREQISSDVKISLVEADASAMKCKYAFKFLGFEKIAKDYGVELVNLSEVEAESVEVQAGTEKFQFMVPKIIKDADLRINLAKSKFMEMCQISVSLKNIFGCNPYPKKFKLHKKLSEAIVALNKVMPFDLIIFDGLIEK